MTIPTVVNVDEVEEVVHLSGDHWGHGYKVLTEGMGDRFGRLHANLTRVPPGRAANPFHTHQREDEIFYVLAGRGVLRYGENLVPLRPGDCVSCPAGSGTGHQIANPYDEDLCYLAIGANDPDEVCTYPDSGKVMIRSLKKIGFLEEAHYMAGDSERPKILDLIEERGLSGSAGQALSPG